MLSILCHRPLGNLAMSVARMGVIGWDCRICCQGIFFPVGLLKRKLTSLMVVICLFTVSLKHSYYQDKRSMLARNDQLAGMREAGSPTCRPSAFVSVPYAGAIR